MSWRVISTCPPFAQTGADAIRKLRAADCALASLAPAGPLAGDTLVSALADADAVIAALDVFDEAVFKALPKLKLVSRWGVGFDAVDLAAATRCGVLVTNTPGVLDETVADLAFALLLGIARKIHTSAASMQHGEWSPEWGADVHSKTLGLIGCGRIGTAVARRARAFNLRVLVFDLRPNGEALALGVEYVGLEKLLAEADFVSLHAAVTDQSRGMIGAEQLRQMKPTAYLINTARGALVDETALAHALNKGQIAGAALDAYCAEPLTRFHPLRTAQNVLLTPHIASLTHENGARISDVAGKAVLELAAGRAPQNIVNPDVLKNPEVRARVTVPSI
jgi:phosphoglycerate dehydrogenase-like enzyme